MVFAVRITYNSALSACEKAADWQGALRLFCHLEDERVKPDVITYSVPELQSVSSCLKNLVTISYLDHMYRYVLQLQCA